MPSRAGRAPALIAASAAAALVIAVVVAVSAAGADTIGSTHQSLLVRCARLMWGEGSASAHPVSGSADPQVAQELSIFRVTRTSDDRLPKASNLDQALGGAEATTYDPSASVRLNLGTDGTTTTYAVPATLAAPTLPARCTQLRRLAGLRALLGLRTLETGSGPGICLVSAPVAWTAHPVSPGKRPPGTMGTSPGVGSVFAGCESLGVMASYLGAFGDGLSGSGSKVVLVPDGVSSVSYAFADGRQIANPVTGNLAAVPASATRSLHLRRATRAKLFRVFKALAPVTVTENGADGHVIATFARPPWLIAEVVKDVLLIERTSSTATTVGSEGSSVACSAQTHRCVAVVVSTNCDPRHDRCTMRRRIERYRYVGRRPPRGTTGRVSLPTGPIRARLDRDVRHPGKLTLVLSGSPHHRVDILESVNCFTRHGGSSSGMARSPLQVAVPSRTSLGRVGRHRVCAVNVLVISSRRGPIHARLARG